MAWLASDMSKFTSVVPWGDLLRAAVLAMMEHSQPFSYPSVTGCCLPLAVTTYLFRNAKAAVLRIVANANIRSDGDWIVGS